MGEVCSVSHAQLGLMGFEVSYKTFQPTHYNVI